MTKIHLKPKSSSTRVIFYKISKPQEKIDLLLRLSQEHFEKKSSLLILVSTDESANFADKVLWSHPTSSFIPHRIAHSDCSDIIIISKSLENYNDSPSILNLSDEPVTHFFSTIYEIEYAKNTAKAKTHYNHYKKNGMHLISL